MATNVLGN